ncbi:bifunctional glutamate N-acetyltransferase/amino-acid acetyltransferase ArgJ [Stieleria sp. TO1_6]|uniref:bifunctional glutamate N-acetyltransferase/amino-acid acetyltransferase ArgJ n=1 Tax=Stieleria tagensis TaxID=2956795 RepID=UPI00209A9C09|nr:bifunctional glutamate N-acetyltransferase/amino-acid acetyltransferase ArgJ [Stieleria tagensis]MCO8124800.1 bifunctional glutamate N-acetyltransferase/amino-acid acetyltransferase ArgJ [Stieleria tagensis]
MTSSPLPSGFQFAGVACGIKPSGKPDLSLIVGDRPLVSAGVYTQNQIVAAPVQWCRARTPSDSIRAVVTNSGNANACTGDQGERDAAEMCRHVADHLSVQADNVLVMSTGVIGQPMPMQRVHAGIDNAAGKLGSGIDDFHAAADAILTTDHARKADCRQIQINGNPVHLAAMAKGAGMIAPNMATMLGVVMTDAVLSPEQAQRILRVAAEESFNRVSVDGHTSTNDTLLLLASGASEVCIDEQNEAAFVSELTKLCVKLARQLVADGEGSTHVIKIQVSGAENDRDADVIARTIGASPLVKTAITGGDPNWGRIVSAAGYADAKIDPKQTSLKLAGTEIYRSGMPLSFDARELSQTMKSSDDVELDLVVGSGPGTAIHWASDLTTDYVRFNSEYTT